MATGLTSSTLTMESRLHNNTTLPIYSEANGTGDLSAGNLNWAVLLLVPIILCSIIGNLLVCLAISRDHKLQNLTNLFIFSMAMADLLVALLVMPFGLAKDLLGYWPMNLIMCNIWSTLDVFCCTSSILHMCSISIDRYVAISDPLRNKRQPRTRRTIVIKICIVWACAATLSSPLCIMGFLHPKTVLNNQQCAVTNIHFMIYGSVVAFFIPLCIVIITYCLTTYTLYTKMKLCQKGDKEEKSDPLRSRERSDSIRSREKSDSLQYRERSDSLRSKGKTDLLHNKEKTDLLRNKEKTDLLRNKEKTDSLLNKDKTDSLQSKEMPKTYPRFVLQLAKKNGFEHISDKNNKVDSTSTENLSTRKEFHLSRLSLNSNASESSTLRSGQISLRRTMSHQRQNGMKRLTTEQRASKVLGLVFIAFVVGWTPFFVANIICAVNRECTIDATVFTICTWIGWASSMVNPFIYTAFNVRFRQAFIRLLSCNRYYPLTKRSSRDRGPVRSVQLRRKFASNEGSMNRQGNTLCVLPEASSSPDAS